MANPFYDDNTNSRGEPLNEDLNFYQQKIESSLASSLASTQRSLRALDETESIGSATAQDLAHQGEQLRNVDQKLDHMQATTVETQKHLNNIKSIFGNIKNYFQAGNSSPNMKNSSSKSSLSGKPDTGTPNATVATSNSTPRSNALTDSSTTRGSTTIPALGGRDTRWGAMDDEIDENLDLMSQNLSRIKSLGVSLGQEIDEQNELLESINDKTDKTNCVIRGQDKQMKKILGHKPTSKSAATDGASQK